MDKKRELAAKVSELFNDRGGRLSRAGVDSGFIKTAVSLGAISLAFNQKVAMLFFATPAICHVAGRAALYLNKAIFKSNLTSKL